MIYVPSIFHKFSIYFPMMTSWIFPRDIFCQFKWLRIDLARHRAWKINFQEFGGRCSGSFSVNSPETHPETHQWIYQWMMSVLVNELTSEFTSENFPETHPEVSPGEFRDITSDSSFWVDWHHFRKFIQKSMMSVHRASTLVMAQPLDPSSHPARLFSSALLKELQEKELQPSEAWDTADEVNQKWLSVSL